MGRVKKIIVLFLCFFAVLFAQAQKTEIPYVTGEKVTYSAYYNWGFIWLRAADVSFSVSQDTYAQNPVYKLFALGTSLPDYDWFFPVRDTFISYIDKETLLPLYFYQNTNEGSYQVRNEFSFNQIKGTLDANLFNNEDGKSAKQYEFTDKLHDVLSAVYFCRTINFDNLKEEDIVPIPTIVDDSIYNLYIRYKGKETIALREGRTFRTIKISVKLIEGTIFKEGEDMTVWISDDQAKVPVLVEAKILIGSVKAYLKNTENLKYPLNSEFED